MYQMEMFFMKPFDVILNRTVLIDDKEDGYFQELLKLSSRERQLLVKTTIKDAE